MDFNSLRLKYHGDPERMEVILQAECRHNCARKLPESLKCDSFIFPSTALAEMATAEPVAALHASLAGDAATALDMTFGLGIDAFALARRGVRVTGVELDSRATLTGQHNARALGLDLEVVNADSVEWLSDSCRRFDLIFIDPARRDGAGRHFALSDCAPDVTQFLPLLLDRGARVMIKCSPMLDITRLRADTRHDADIISVGTRRECKELLVILPGTGLTRAVTVDDTGIVAGIPGDAPPAPCYPREGAWLLEPYPAVMKAGAAALLDDRFGSCRLAPSTHLYCSSSLPGDFPGEAFEIIQAMEFNKRNLSAVARRYPMLNVATRNFPLSAPQLIKKMGIREGGDHRLFGVTDSHGKRLLIITKL